MEPIPCIKNKCLKYPICKYKEHIDCAELYTYYKGLYTHYKKDSNQSNQSNRHDIFNNVYSKVIEYLHTTLPNLRGITGEIYIEHIQTGFSSLKGNTEIWKQFHVLKTNV